MVATIKPTASTDFSTNGKLYSASVMTLSQNDVNTAWGLTFRFGDGANKTITSNMSVSPTIKSGQLATPVIDGLTADAFTYTTNAGMALTSGTVTASNSTVQAFKEADAGVFGINVTHTATLAATLATTAIQVQQVTCLDIYTTAPAQYLCILTDIANVSKTTATSTFRVIHEVYSMDTDVRATAFTLTAKALNDSTGNLLNAANKGALMYKATSNTVLVGKDATLKGMDIPSSKMTWPGGNYVSHDLKNMQAKVGYIGAANSAAVAAGNNKTTVDLIKTGLASAFTGTAAMSGSTWVSKVSETTALAVKTAAACTDPTEATCISKHPTKCKASGALSTVATVGAAIAALAMSF